MRDGQEIIIAIGLNSWMWEMFEEMEMRLRALTWVDLGRSKDADRTIRQGG